jgi:hypothetical protein
MEPRSAPPPNAPRRPSPQRPDPTRLRLLLGVGGLAALSALVTAIVTPPPLAAPVPVGPTAAPATPATITQRRPIRYVQLAPGQTPPPGARVIDAKAPMPITIVTQVPAPAQQTIVVRTTQSGKVIP